MYGLKSKMFWTNEPLRDKVWKCCVSESSSGNLSIIMPFLKYHAYFFLLPTSYICLYRCLPMYKFNLCLCINLEMNPVLSLLMFPHLFSISHTKIIPVDQYQGCYGMKNPSDSSIKGAKVLQYSYFSSCFATSLYSI